MKLSLDRIPSDEWVGGALPHMLEFEYPTNKPPACVKQLLDYVVCPPPMPAAVEMCSNFVIHGLIGVLSSRIQQGPLNSVAIFELLLAVRPQQISPTFGLQGATILPGFGITKI